MLWRVSSSPVSPPVRSDFVSTPPLFSVPCPRSYRSPSLSESSSRGTKKNSRDGTLWISSLRTQGLNVGTGCLPFDMSKTSYCATLMSDRSRRHRDRGGVRGPSTRPGTQNKKSLFGVRRTELTGSTGRRHILLEGQLSVQ